MLCVCNCCLLALQALLDANDYLGVSGYGSGYRLKQLTWSDMEIPLQTLAYEMNFFGIDLKQYMKKKPVIYVEQVRAARQQQHFSAVVAVIRVRCNVGCGNICKCCSSGAILRAKQHVSGAG